MEPNKLCDETQIWIDDLPPGLDPLKRSFVVDSFGHNQVTENYGSRSRNTLDAVNKNSPIFSFGPANEVDCVIENALNVLMRVVFEMISLVFYPHLLVVVQTIIRWTIDHVGDSILFKNFMVFGNEIWP